MYITSKHLQILKFIKNNSNFTLKDIADIFKMSPQYTKFYIEDIYSELYDISKEKLKIEEILHLINISTNSQNILRQNQYFTKNQNIFYILLLLAQNNSFKLGEVSDLIGVTTRNLNNYFPAIKEILNIFFLDLESSYRGFNLIGSDESINNFKFFLFFKFLIEKEFLPGRLRVDFLNFFKFENFKSLKREVESDFIKYINRYSNQKYFSNTIDEKIKSVLEIFTSYFGETNNSDFMDVLKTHIFYCQLKDNLFIDDSYFLNLNLSSIVGSNFAELVKDIQNILPSFTILEGLTLWYSFFEKRQNEEKNIFIFKYLNKSIVPAILKEIYKKHNIIIKDYINISDLKNYLKENNVHNAITIENLNINREDVDVKNIFIPILNYEKINLG
ncbi:MAG: hypothetical protein ACRC5F_00950 [Cetobacterium sp.]